MSLFIAVDLLSAVLLLLVFQKAWKEKKTFFPITFVLPAAALLAIGRISDVLLEHPSLRHAGILGLSSETYEVVIAAIGNLSDVVGISFLVLGFGRIISHEQKSARLIDQLETMLPICSYCKKYRTKDNEWLPIEKFLKEQSGKMLTHGVCPECYAKIKGDFSRKGGQAPGSVLGSSGGQRR